MILLIWLLFDSTKRGEMIGGCEEEIGRGKVGEIRKEGRGGRRRVGYIKGKRRRKNTTTQRNREWRCWWRKQAMGGSTR